MALTLPQHIAGSGLLANPLSFKWDDDPWACEFEVPRLDNDIGALYSRAVMAFAVATAEWVIWPLSHGKDPLFLDFVEACWAAVADRRYLRHVSREFADRIGKHYRISPKAGTAEDLWRTGELADPVRGPQFVAIQLLELVADRTAPDDNGSMEAVYLSNRVDQVTKKSPAYRNWRRTILDRLQQHHGQTEDDDDNWLGPAVPREALSPTFAYSADQATLLVKSFLRGLDPARNRFLTPAAEMKKLGFDADPYDP